MSEYDPYNEFSGEQPPIPIPPVEEGWEKMAWQLDGALPVTTLQRFVARVWKFICIDVSMVAIAFTNVVYTSNNKASQEVKSAQYVAVVDDSINQQPDSLLQEQVNLQTIYWLPGNNEKNKLAEKEKQKDLISPDLGNTANNETGKNNNWKNSSPGNKQPGENQSAAGKEKDNNPPVIGSKKKEEILAGRSEDRKHGANSTSPAEKSKTTRHYKPANHGKETKTSSFKEPVQTIRKSLTGTEILDQHPAMIQQSGELTDIGREGNKSQEIRSGNGWPDIRTLTINAGIPSGLSKPPPGLPGHIINKKQSTARERSWQFQLQLPYLLPFNNTNGYLDGPSGNRQLHRLFLPTLRVANMTSKAGWSLDVNLWSFQGYPDSPFYAKPSGIANQLDKETWSLRQTFGISLAALYHHRITGNWWGAAGGSIYMARQASVLKVKLDTLGNLASRMIEPNDQSVFQHIKKIQGNVIAETYVDVSPFQGGIRMNVPVFIPTKDSVGKGLKPPAMTVEVLLRFNLNSLFTKKPHH